MTMNEWRRCDSVVTCYDWTEALRYSVKLMDYKLFVGTQGFINVNIKKTL